MMIINIWYGSFIPEAIAYTGQVWAMTNAATHLPN